MLLRFVVHVCLFEEGLCLHSPYGCFATSCVGFVSQRSDSHWPWLIWNPVQLRSAAAQLLSHMCRYCSTHTLKHTPTISQCPHALMLALSPTWEELGLHLNKRWPFETRRHFPPSPTSPAAGHRDGSELRGLSARVAVFGVAFIYEKDLINEREAQSNLAQTHHVFCVSTQCLWGSVIDDYSQAEVTVE